MAWSRKKFRNVISCVCLALVMGSACADDELQLKYLGVAGWEIKSGNVVVLTDPYITRLKFDHAKLAENRNKYLSTYYPESDTAAIDRIITRADFILIHHSHPDHILDVPYIAKKTGAKVLGTETSMNILRAYAVPEEQLYTVKGGEDYQFGDFSIRVIPSIHSALGQKRYFDSKVHTTVPKAPLSMLDYIEGGSLMFLSRFKGGEVMSMGSMNYLEREVEGLRPDVLLAGSGESQTEIYDYARRLLRAVGYPKLVMPTHWDDLAAAYDNEVAQASARKAKAELLMRDVARIAPQTKFIIPEHMKTITFKK